MNPSWRSATWETLNLPRHHEHCDDVNLGQPPANGAEGVPSCGPSGGEKAIGRLCAEDFGRREKLRREGDEYGMLREELDKYRSTRYPFVLFAWSVLDGLVFDKGWVWIRRRFVRYMKLFMFHLQRRIRVFIGRIFKLGFRDVLSSICGKYLRLGKVRREYMLECLERKRIFERKSKRLETRWLRRDLNIMRKVEAYRQCAMSGVVSIREYEDLQYNRMSASDEEEDSEIILTCLMNKKKECEKSVTEDIRSFHKLYHQQS